MQRALGDLMMRLDERRPVELRLLRDRIERNLSGLMGPRLARMVVDESLRMTRAREPPSLIGYASSSNGSTRREFLCAVQPPSSRPFSAIFARFSKISHKAFARSAPTPTW